MRVQAKAFFRYGGANYEPDDFLDLTEAEADDYIKRRLAKKSPKPKVALSLPIETAADPVEAETAESEVAEIETEMMQGAPEHALSRRGRPRRRNV